MSTRRVIHLSSSQRVNQASEQLTNDILEFQLSPLICLESIEGNTEVEGTPPTLPVYFESEKER